MAPLELPGPWLLPVANFDILTVTFSERLTIVAYGGDAGTCKMSFACELEIRDALGVAAVLDVANQPWESWVSVLSLRRDRLASATATADGTLRIALASGRSLTAAPDASYESWEVSGPDPLSLIAPPGGGDPRWKP